MDTVLICVAPNDHPSVYEFFINSLQDQGWDLLIIPVTEISTVKIEGVAAVLAYAVNWPKESLHGWLSDTRLGHRTTQKDAGPTASTPA